MAARVGLSREVVLAEAVLMLSESGDPATVTLGAISRRLGIRPQSIYTHVDGADGLADAMAIAGLASLRDQVRPAAIGRSGADAVAAIVRAHIDHATTHPGLHLAALRPPRDDAALRAAIVEVNQPLEIVLSTLGLDPVGQVHWTRLFLSAVTGFVMLRIDGRLSLPVDADETAEQLIAMLIGQLPAS